MHPIADAPPIRWGYGRALVRLRRCAPTLTMTAFLPLAKHAQDAKGGPSTLQPKSLTANPDTQKVGTNSANGDHKARHYAANSST